MDNTTQYMKVNGEIYLIMSEKLFELRIRSAYINGEINAYRNVEDGYLMPDTTKGDD